MRLVDLDPRWLMKDDKRVGFVFKSPTLGDDMWMAIYEPHPGYHELWRAINAAFPEGKKNAKGFTRSVQTMNARQSWTVTGDTFETITVSPSLDGSPAGNWHGFIQNGNIVGGI